MKMIKGLYPNYADIIDKVMHSTRGYFCYIFIMKWDIFQEDMKWVFDIMMAFTNQIDSGAAIYRFNKQ